MQFPIGTAIYPDGAVIYHNHAAIGPMGAMIFTLFYPYILMTLYSTSLKPAPLAIMMYTRVEILEKISRLEDNEWYTGAYPGEARSR